jgi:hypothetical protein
MKEMKNKIAAGSTYDGFKTCVEKLSTHGAVNIQIHKNHSGISLVRHLIIYSPKKKSEINVIRFNKMYGASGIGKI